MQPKEERPIGYIGDQPLRLVCPPFLITKEQNMITIKARISGNQAPLSEFRVGSISLQVTKLWGGQQPSSVVVAGENVELLISSFQVVSAQRSKISPLSTVETIAGWSPPH